MRNDFTAYLVIHEIVKRLFLIKRQRYQKLEELKEIYKQFHCLDIERLKSYTSNDVCIKSSLC